MRSLQKNIALFIICTLVCFLFAGCDFFGRKDKGETAENSPKPSIIKDSGQTGLHSEDTESTDSGHGTSEALSSETDSSSSHSESSSYMSGEEPIGAEVTLLVEVGDGKITWRAENATIFEVYADGALVAETVGHAFSDFTTGVHSVEIRAYETVGKGRYVSETVEVIARAPAPEVTYDKDKELLQWESIPGAEGYRINKNGEFCAEINQCGYRPIDPGVYSVCAVFDDERLNSDFCGEIPINVLLTRPQISIDGDMLFWKKVPGAVFYKVVFDNGARTEITPVGVNPDFITHSIINIEWVKDNYPNGVNIYVIACGIDSEGNDVESAPSNSVLFDPNAN